MDYRREGRVRECVRIHARIGILGTCHDRVFFTNLLWKDDIGRAGEKSLCALLELCTLLCLYCKRTGDRYKLYTDAYIYTDIFLVFYMLYVSVDKSWGDKFCVLVHVWCF